MDQKHPNEKGDQEVILLKFKKDQTATISDDQIKQFYEKAREIFKVEGQKN